MSRHYPPLKDRFDEAFIPEPNSGCWLWMKSTDRIGYGHMHRGASTFGEILAHRISWRLHRGRIPSGMHVLHHCDVHCCVNPSHLFLGTHQDNMADRDRKGRNRVPIGTAQWKSVLTPKLVLEIRASAESARVIAKRLGVTRGAIQGVRRGITWKHV